MSEEDSGRRGRIHDLYGKLHDKAQYDENADKLGILREGMEAYEFEGEPLPIDQLMKLLGVERDEKGNIPRVPLFNACLNVEEFEGIKSLTREERIRAMHSAFRVLDTIFSGH